jgi:hypothetical protein
VLEGRKNAQEVLIGDDEGVDHVNNSMQSMQPGGTSAQQEEKKQRFRRNSKDIPREQGGTC